MYSMTDAVKDHAKVIAKEGISTVTILEFVDAPNTSDTATISLANLYGTALELINRLTKELEKERSK